MVERIQMSSEDPNPSLEEQAAAQEAASASEGQDGGDKILGKFDSYEDLEKSYTELQREYTKLKQGGGTQAAQEDDPGDGDGSEGDEGDGNDLEDKARDLVEDAGLDFDAFRASYDTNGSLTDEEYEALEKGGIPRYWVDEFIAGQEARKALLENKVFDSVGGKDSYVQMTQWAADNLSEEEIEIYNTEVNSGNEKRIQFAVNGLKAQYDRAVGFEPSRQIAGKSAGKDNTAYESWAQVQADMSDPRYTNDPAFRAKVEQKLARSGSL